MTWRNIKIAMQLYCEPFFEAVERWRNYDNVELLMDRLYIVEKICASLKNDTQHSYHQEFRLRFTNENVKLLEPFVSKAGPTYVDNGDKIAFEESMKLVPQAYFQIIGFYFQDMVLTALAGVSPEDLAKSSEIVRAQLIEAFKTLCRLPPSAGPARLERLVRLEDGGESHQVSSFNPKEMSASLQKLLAILVPRRLAVAAVSPARQVQVPTAVTAAGQSPSHTSAGAAVPKSVTTSAEEAASVAISAPVAVPETAPASAPPSNHGPASDRAPAGPVSTTPAPVAVAPTLNPAPAQAATNEDVQRSSTNLLHMLTGVSEPSSRPRGGAASVASGDRLLTSSSGASTQSKETVGKPAFIAARSVGIDEPDDDLIDVQDGQGQPEEEVDQPTEADDEEWSTEHESVGMNVMALFYPDKRNKMKRKKFQGQVTRYLPESRPGAKDELYHILWEDNDECDYDRKQFKDGRKMYMDTYPASRSSAQGSKASAAKAQKPTSSSTTQVHVLISQAPVETETSAASDVDGSGTGSA